MARLFSREGERLHRREAMLRESLVSTPTNKPEPRFYASLWSAFLQAFTVEDTFHRKIK